MVASATTTAVPSSSTEPEKQASGWPFPLVLPGTPASTSLPPPVTISEPQGLGYEYGPEIFIDDADYWEDASASNPFFTPKPLASRKEKSKKGEKSKLCPTNGYQGAPKGKVGEKKVQVKYSTQEKQWTVSTKEFLPGGGVKRIHVTYITAVEIEEECPVDSEGNVVVDADDGDIDPSLMPRAGETNLDVDWSSDEEEEDSSDSSGSSDSDDGGKKHNRNKSK